MRRLAFGALAAIVIVAAIYAGFLRTPARNTQTHATRQDNPLEAARQVLSRETDHDSCRAALAHLNAHLSSSPSVRVPTLSDAERAALRDRHALDEKELNEIARTQFTQLDGHYLDLCFLMRDAAGSLATEVVVPEGTRHPEPLRQAEAAFAWTVRQVRLEPSAAPPVSPQFALRRGWGTALERALIFLELLRRLGVEEHKLTGCLVLTGDNLWACGVLIDDKPEIYLFDPRLGLPVPGALGRGIATLAAARSDPAVLAQLSSAEGLSYDVTAEQATKADVRYVCSLSALAPRLRLLETELLAPSVQVRLGVDDAAEIARLQAAVKNQVAPDATARPWRGGAGVMRRFLPPAEGGSDESVPSRKIVATRQLIPAYAMPPFLLDENLFPPDIGLGLLVRGTFGEPYRKLILEPHHARDELLRGRSQKAVPELVDSQDACLAGQYRLRQEEERRDEFAKEIRAWLEKAHELYADQRRSTDPVARERIGQAIEVHWRNAQAIGALVTGCRSWPLRMQSAYWLALCKHEQAEYLQGLLELNDQDPALQAQTVDAWKEAVNLWQRYLDVHRNAESQRDANVPARAALRYMGTAAAGASRLLGRAQVLSGDRAGALQTWRQDPSASGLEKVGSLYLAKMNGK